LRRAFPLAALVGLAACIHRPPFTRLEQPTPITLAVILDRPEGAQIDEEPRALAHALAHELDRRNLDPERLPADQAASLGATHDTRARAALLAKALGPGKEFLLVELKTSYFDYMEGRHKWVVQTRLMVGRTDRLDVASTADFDVSVFLPFDFEGPKEAQEQAADDIAERLGRLLDNHYAGQPEAVPAPAAKAAPAHAAAGWSARPLYFVLLDRFAPSERGEQGPLTPALSPVRGEGEVGPSSPAGEEREVGTSSPAGEEREVSTSSPAGEEKEAGPSSSAGEEREAGSSPPAGERPGEGAVRVDRSDPAAWHGGDLATLRRHLDDLQALGVGAVWLSPVSRCREGKKGQWGGYHCYWVEDLGAFEPRFGTPEELRALRDELHARGMRLVLDVVLNHVAPDSPLLARHPDWFHPKKPLLDYGNRQEVEQAWLANLPDLAQEKPAVADYLIETVSKWVREVAPDGLRLDAVKHVPVAFWRRFTREMHAERPGLEIIGEDLDGDAATLASEAREGGFDALFDFPLRSEILGAACEGAPVGGVAARLGLDRLDAPGAGWATLLDNHDLPRLASACPDFDHAAAALELLFLLRGIPTLTYGVEAGLAGKGDPENRGDLEFPVRSPYRDLIARLSALRAGHPALAEGRSCVRAADRDGFVLYRAAPGGEVACVFVARGRGEAPLDPGWTQVFHDERGGLTLDVEVSSDAEARRTVARAMAPASPRDIRVVPDGPPALGPGDTLSLVGAAPELGAWNPAHGAPLSVHLPADEVYELKLVVRRASGQVEWEPGPNELVYVQRGEGAQAVALRWPKQS